MQGSNALVRWGGGEGGGGKLGSCCCDQKVAIRTAILNIHEDRTELGEEEGEITTRERGKMQAAKINGAYAKRRSRDN
jgi:hypothetical protein